MLGVMIIYGAGMVELADTTDLKSVGAEAPCGFKSRSRHQEKRIDANGP